MFLGLILGRKPWFDPFRKRKRAMRNFLSVSWDIRRKVSLLSIFCLLSKPVPSPQHLHLRPCCCLDLFIQRGSWSFQQKSKVQPKNCGFPGFRRSRFLHWPFGRANRSPFRQQAWWEVWLQEHPPTSQGSSWDEVYQWGFTHWQQPSLAHKPCLWKPTLGNRRRVPIKSSSLKLGLERVEPPFQKWLQIFEIRCWSVQSENGQRCLPLDWWVWTS